MTNIRSSQYHLIHPILGIANHQQNILFSLSNSPNTPRSHSTQLSLELGDHAKQRQV
ncbi:MAG: hypothetical protein ACK5VA_16395 [Pseudanabaena sp.]|nr:hypothetical protein [Pseudanabaena sp. M53BS1SP1A06MG]MCA6581581.1 hypothetical protein [Pseudanabaena sp. M34BS1SP1A06MG]MCA6592372.1 hypothetical protein [Pseudanabaena sp. M38BS1SP1A06MG]